jgi:hypothetical protein
MSPPRKISVTLTGPEGMLEAMAKLLRDEGYGVVAPGERHRIVSMRANAVLIALGMLADVQVAKLAKDWRFAELEQKRRKAEARAEVTRARLAKVKR